MTAVAIKVCPQAEHDAMRAGGREFFRASTAHHADWEEGGLELRNCHCGTTLAYPLPGREAEFFHPDGTPKSPEED